MTTLPERLRASAQAMRGLFLVSENVPNVRMIYKEDRDRIARELEEAAQALEAQSLTLDQRYWLDRRAEIIDALAADGLQICSDKDKVWLRRSAAPAAQVAQEGGGVATAPQCPKGCGLMGTFFDGWRCNHCGETARGVSALPTPKLCPGCAQYHGRNDCPVGWLAPAEPYGVPASEYLAKIKADPRRAAALQRARDRAAGVREGQP